jgi:predicted small metal-binding protein
VKKVLRCDCGFEARADNDEALVASVREHARSVHGMELSVADVHELTARSEHARTSRPIEREEAPSER